MKVRGLVAWLDDHLNPIVVKELRQAVQRALPTAQPTVEVPKFEPRLDAQYVLRCVYERPQCDPPVTIVSQPSVPFQLAPFFDPEAPARPVRIPLPADVSIAGLRKLKKNVAFMMSDAMRKKVASIAGKEQVHRTKELRSFLFALHKNLAFGGQDHGGGGRAGFRRLKEECRGQE